MTGDPPTDCRILTLGAADVAIMNRMLCLFGEVFDEMSVYQDAVPRERYLSSAGSHHPVLRCRRS